MTYQRECFPMCPDEKIYKCSCALENPIPFAGSSAKSGCCRQMWFPRPQLRIRSSTMISLHRRLLKCCLREKRNVTMYGIRHALLLYESHVGFAVTTRFTYLGLDRHVCHLFVQFSARERDFSSKYKSSSDSSTVIPNQAPQHTISHTCNFPSSFTTR